MTPQHPITNAKLSEIIVDFLSSLGDKAQLPPEQGVTLELPAPIFKVLIERLQELAQSSEDAEMSTKKAANLLQVSRPYFVKLLDEGKIPFRKVGVYRRVRAADVLAYKETLWSKAEAAADALVQEAQGLGLYPLCK